MKSSCGSSVNAASSPHRSRAGAKAIGSCSTTSTSSSTSSLPNAVHSMTLNGCANPPARSPPPSSMRSSSTPWPRRPAQPAARSQARSVEHDRALRNPLLALPAQRQRPSRRNRNPAPRRPKRNPRLPPHQKRPPERNPSQKVNRPELALVRRFEFCCRCRKGAFAGALSISGNEPGLEGEPQRQPHTAPKLVEIRLAIPPVPDHVRLAGAVRRQELLHVVARFQLLVQSRPRIEVLRTWK